MNDHALRVLEFPAALDLVASWAQSGLGKDRVRALRPSTDIAVAQAELNRVGEVASFLLARDDFAPPPIPDVRAALTRLNLEGGVLDAQELYQIGLLLASSRELAEVIRDVGDDYPRVEAIRPLLMVDAETERTILRTAEPDGTVLDTASRDLRRIRESLRRARSRIVSRLEAFIKTLPTHVVVPDGSVTIREGRYAVPIRRGGRREVGGLVHDESATGATLFVEPPVAIELMNEIRELEREEWREIQRILRELSAGLRPRTEELRASQDALVDFDSLYARARSASAWMGEPPELLPAGRTDLRIVQGRHPILLGRGSEGVVPFDLALAPGERGLIVSGPNTGGKSVLLKSLGLIALLAQSGVVPPVGKGTRLPVFTDVFADIGDEQSITESLSTFSAHLSNLREIIERAGPDSLVLMDEMGTGTDPEEGAALAQAILEELVARGTLTVATSHLGALKRFATEGSGLVNASLQFDPERLEPTFVFAKGRPGRSYGLAIARNLGFPVRVMNRAEGYVSEGESRIEELLERLELEERETAASLEAADRDEREAARLKEELERRESALQERERTAQERAREEARRLLLDARSEVEHAIREVRDSRDATDAEAAAHQARRRVEAAALRLRAEGGRPKLSGPGRPVRTGDRVRLTGSGARGKVVEARDGRAVVESGGLRIRVPLSDVEAVGEGGGGEPRPTTALGGWTGPEVQASPEVDLRGLQVDEVEPALMRALDEGILADLGELRIIHGKGTGALRSKVAELLAADVRVREFRLGRTGEGGSGVTMVKLA